ncbi:hypothetical protein BG000_001232 [Podila horticola]|nr:hypothetical protein BG000_001232 [Podila horticola]
MTDNLLSLFCLIDGEATPFSIKIPSGDTVDSLKDIIKAKKSPEFDDIAADKLDLWHVSIPIVPPDMRKPIFLREISSPTVLDPTDDISDVFKETPPKKTIHIIVQRPPLVHTPIPARVSSPLPGYLSDNSRPGTPLSGDLHADIKKITDKFFAPGPITTFLNAFVRGEGALPVTTGTIRGCGKTRAVIELLSQHWGFYFNASSDDWGSSDMIEVHSTVEKHLNETRDSPTVDRQVNNAYARKTTLLLFFSRLLIFKHCLNVPGSSETFTSARWTLLQVCSHVLFKDIFNILFIQVLKLRHHRESILLDLVRDVYEDMKGCLIKRGCLPKIKDDTRLLVVHDEAQFLGDAFSGSFQSMSSSDESPRPLLSPILHAFRDIGEHQLTLVTCGTGLSINTLFWVQSSGSGLKDSSTNFEYMEFPGWTDKESMKAYISRVRKCLLDDDSRLALDERLPQEAIDMLFEKLVGRFRPAAVAIEKIIEGIEQGAWQFAIEDTEDKLVSWDHREIKGNLCNELDRLHNKYTKHSRRLVKSILNILRLCFYRRCVFGEDKVVLNEAYPPLVERAFGRIKIVHGHAVTVLDEPFVSKAVENYFVAMDPYFKNAIRDHMEESISASYHGCVFEQFMMTVFSETFKTRPLSEWRHEPPISKMCGALVGKVEIVGWREPGLEQGTTHKNMSMEEFMDAHVNHQSTRNNKAVAPFFFPKSKPSGPDMVFFIRIDGCRMVPVFVQMKLHQRSSTFYEKDWNDALSTVSAPKIESHAKGFRDYCPDKVYISMIVAYPTKWSSKMPALSDLPKDTSGVQQVVINVDDDNFGDIFPREHVEFIDRLKNAGKRSAGDEDDSDGEDRSKKPKIKKKTGK